MNRDRINPRFYPGSDLDDQPHYVYTFWAGSTPLYVGCTNDLQRRMKEHAKTWPFLHADSTWIAWTVLPDRESGLTAEAERIVKLMPRYNVRHNPGCQRLTTAIANHLAWEEWSAAADALEARIAKRAAA